MHPCLRWTSDSPASAFYVAGITGLRYQVGPEDDLGVVTSRLLAPPVVRELSLELKDWGF